MSDRHRKLSRVIFGNATLRYLNMIAVVITGFALIPQLVAHVPRSEYSFWISTLIFQAVVQNSDFGIPLIAQQRLAAQYEDHDPVALGVSASAVLILSAVISIVIGAVSQLALFVATNTATATSSFHGFFTHYETFSLALFANALNIYGFSASGVVQGLQSRYFFGLITLCSTLTTYFVTTHYATSGIGARSIAYGLMASAIIVALFSTIYIITRLFSVMFSLKAVDILSCIGEIARHGRSLFLSRFVIPISSYFDFFLVNMVAQERILVDYFLMRKSVDIVKDACSQIFAVSLPAISRLDGDQLINSRRKADTFNKWKAFILWLSSFAAFGIIAFNETFMALWLGGDFFISNVLNNTFAVGLALLLCVNGFLIYKTAQAEFSLVAKVQITQVVVFLVLSVGMGYFLGVLGVACASLASWFYVILFAKGLGFGFMPKFDQRSLEIPFALFLCNAAPAFFVYYILSVGDYGLMSFVLFTVLYAVASVLGGWFVVKDLFRNKQ